jgi:hypothetical protein
MFKIDDYYPVAGDLVLTHSGTYRVKSSSRRRGTVDVYVPKGTDLDGDVEFDVEMITIDDIIHVTNRV